MTVANHGILAGLSGQEVYDDIRRSTPRGSRTVADKEIQETIDNAIEFHGNGQSKPYKKTQVASCIIPEKNTFSTISATGKYSTEDELKAASPIPIPDDPVAQQRLFLETVFLPDDLVFSGEKVWPGTPQTIKPVCEWTLSGAPGPLISSNPLSGLMAPKKDGSGMTYRGDNCVKYFRNAIVEFDNQPFEDQVRFWSAIKLPVKALVHSGGKSLHAWLDVSSFKINNIAQWEKEIEVELYEKRLVRFQPDMSCSTPAHLTRIPGVFRKEKDQWQRLLWLSDRGINV